ncbi:MAG: hypothetical protein QXL15_00890 [Candidatus Korarchaeota archaeon]
MSKSSEIKIYVPPLHTTEGKIMMLLFDYPSGLSLKRISMMLRAHYDTIVPAVVKLMEDGIITIVQKGSKVRDDVIAISEEFLKKLPSEELIIAEIDNLTKVVNKLLAEAKEEEERVMQKIREREKEKEEKIKMTTAEVSTTNQSQETGKTARKRTRRTKAKSEEKEEKK